MQKRLAFEVDEELAERLRKLPWGLKTAILRKTLEMVADAYERQGSMFLAAMLDDQLAFTAKPKVEELVDG